MTRHSWWSGSGTASLVRTGWALAIGATACGTTVAERPIPHHEMPDGSAPGRRWSSPDAGGGLSFGPAAPTDGAVTYAPCAASTDASAETEHDAAVEIPIDGGELTVLLVFDKSTSMEESWDERTRWQAASDAMIAGITPQLDHLTLGAILFPQISSCNVAPLEHPIQINFLPGREFVSTWLERACWPKQAWGTPLELAFKMADQAIANATENGALANRFRVLVVTDGDPTCQDDPTHVVSYAAGWSERGVSTYVLGLPGSEGATELLDAVAAAGGTGKHQSPGSPREFQQQIAAAVR